MKTEVFTCDKCGAEFHERGGGTLTVPGSALMSGGRVLAYTSGESGGHHDVDLCRECLRKFNTWLAQRDEEPKEKAQPA